MSSKRKVFRTARQEHLTRAKTMGILTKMERFHCSHLCPKRCQKKWKVKRKMATRNKTGRLLYWRMRTRRQPQQTTHCPTSLQVSATKAPLADHLWAPVSLQTLTMRKRFLLWKTDWHCFTRRTLGTVVTPPSRTDLPGAQPKSQKLIFAYRRCNDKEIKPSMKVRWAPAKRAICNNQCLLWAEIGSMLGPSLTENHFRSTLRRR